MRIYGIPFRERCILKKHLSIIYVSFAGCRFCFGAGKFLSVAAVFFRWLQFSFAGCKFLSVLQVLFRCRLEREEPTSGAQWAGCSAERGRQPERNARLLEGSRAGNGDIQKQSGPERNVPDLKKTKILSLFPLLSFVPAL